MLVSELAALLKSAKPLACRILRVFHQGKRTRSVRAQNPSDHCETRYRYRRKSNSYRRPHKPSPYLQIAYLHPEKCSAGIQLENPQLACLRAPVGFVARIPLFQGQIRSTHNWRLKPSKPAGESAPVSHQRSVSALSRPQQPHRDHPQQTVLGKNLRARALHL